MISRLLCFFFGHRPDDCDIAVAVLKKHSAFVFSPVTSVRCRRCRAIMGTVEFYPMKPAAEREFLIRLAATWLKCRYKVMGHRVIGDWSKKPDLAFDLLGCHDYAAEMALLAEECRRRA